MPYLQRNLYYVRVSPHAVLQTILYVDPSNLRWLNSGLHSDNDDDESDLTDDRDGHGLEEGERERTGDRIWARALMHLRERVMAKLRKESAENGSLASNNTTTRGKVDTHIDVDFQMAYFFRQTTGRHAVLLKNKEMVFPAKVEMPPPMMPASAMRSNRDELRPSRLAERQQISHGDETVLAEGDAMAGGDEYNAERNENLRKRRRSPLAVRIKDEVETDDIELLPNNEDHALDDQIHTSTIDVDQEQADQKPRVKVSYSGFQIFGKSLIIVIEPTKRTKRLRAPLFQARTRTKVHQLSVMPISEEERAASVRPNSTSVNRADSRAQSSTPQLFLGMRSASIASSFDGNEDVMGEQRADSRRATGRADAAPLFRGTPSEWDPTPTPTPVPESRSEQRIDADGEDDDEEEGEGILRTQSVMLATQLMEADVSANRVNDLDEDEL